MSIPGGFPLLASNLAVASRDFKKSHSAETPEPFVLRYRSMNGTINFTLFTLRYLRANGG
jgi:hypothetical protein